MSDLISREAALDAIEWTWAGKAAFDAIKALPSALPERKAGRWMLVKGSNGKDYRKCSECLHTQEITGVMNYCAVCGARME